MKFFAYFLIIIPLILITLRVVTDPDPDPGIISELEYEITYQYDLQGSDSDYIIQSFLPTDNRRQDVEMDSDSLLQPGLSVFDKAPNKVIKWSGRALSDTTISIRFSAKTKGIEFDIDNKLKVDTSSEREFEDYLSSTTKIQSNSPKVKALADRLRYPESESAKDLAEGYFNYVRNLSSVDITDSTDALSCLKSGVCSDKGKSRLLAALYRSSGIPARVVGGLILEDGMKKTSHYWMEARFAEEWVPFDTQEGHFAELPQNYLEISYGDYNLNESHLGLDVDYLYNTSRDRLHDYSAYAAFNLWNLIDNNQLPMKPVMVLILLPLGAYIVGIFKNVIGFKTYGVFLPVLIAFSFVDMGLIEGLIFFSVIIGLISLLSFPIEKWGILHTPKIVFLLTLVSLYCLVAIKIFYITGWVNPSATLTFPIIILTLISERFAHEIEEESLADALLLYGQTLIVTVCCYLIVSAGVVQHFFITFPEALITIAGMSLLLGRWIGLQLFEYSRFSQIDEKVSYAN